MKLVRYNALGLAGPALPGNRRCTFSSTCLMQTLRRDSPFIYVHLLQADAELPAREHAMARLRDAQYEVYAQKEWFWCARDMPITAYASVLKHLHRVIDLLTTVSSAVCAHFVSSAAADASCDFRQVL